MRLIKSLLFFLGIGALIIGYRLRQWVLARVLRLTPPRYGVKVEYQLRVPMRDGVLLATDHYRPNAAGDFPTILMRSPYGSRGGSSFFGSLMQLIGYRFAERGYHVVIQDIRGRFDSGGRFNPLFNEQIDGLDTVQWVREQPWFNGVIGTWGPSYLGLVQWAIVADVPEIKAMVPSVTGTQLHWVLYPDGAFDLGLAMRWMGIFQLLDRDKDRPFWASALFLWEVERKIAPAFRHLPIGQADQIALGERVDFYQEWLEHRDPHDEIWDEARDAMRPDEVTAPVHLVGGWHDFFLRTLLSDYAALRDAGQRPYLTIGPWDHFSRAFVMFDSLREGIAWFDAHLKGDSGRLRQRPVRVYVMGLNRWREMDEWPPPSIETCYFLRGGNELSREEPAGGLDAIPDMYAYDPADPTPALGGTQFSWWAGRVDNRKLEARRDVLTYTTHPLQAAVEIMGSVRLELYVQSNLAHTDFFGRLCDVYPNGRSMNVCDGLFRVEPGKGKRQPDSSLRIEIDLWATAYRFRRGHRIRLQVSSGAHPRWNRNLGTGDQLGTAMKIAEQQVFHDTAHPSVVVLPVVRMR